jgi:hypothetical protein
MPIAQLIAALTGDDVTDFDFINVKDPAYGATGDGVTDDTAAFAAAITAAYSTALTAAWGSGRHRRIFVPAGVYCVSKINLYSGSDTNGLWLDGVEGSVIKGTSDGQNVINIQGNDVFVSNFLITRAAGHTTGHGISYTRPAAFPVLRARLENVTVDNQPQDAIYSEGVEHGFFLNTTGRDSGRYGWYFRNVGGTVPGFENTFINCSARNNTNFGFYTEDQEQYTLINFEALNNAPTAGSSGAQIKFGIDSAGSTGHTLINPDVENFDGDKLGRGVHFVGGTNGVVGGTGYELHTGIYLGSNSNTSVNGFRCERTSSLSGSSVVFCDSATNFSQIHVPAGNNMANTVGLDAAATGTVAQIAEQLQMQAARVIGVSRTPTVNSATPDLKYSDWWTTANSSSTTITSFTNARTGLLHVLIGDANTTFAHGSTLKLRGAVNWTPASGDRISFVCFGGTAYEISRETAASPGAVLSGAGTPEAAVTAGIGTLYLRTNGGAATTLYVKESGTGNTGWVGK